MANNDEQTVGLKGDDLRVIIWWKLGLTLEYWSCVQYKWNERASVGQPHKEDYYRLKPKEVKSESK